MPPLLDNVNEISLTPIQKFYSGANIFVTGGTGFLGQLLIEKLLRSCPDIGNIYMLIREKKNKNMYTRVDEILDGEVFSKLREAFPKYKYKIIGIQGDCSLPNLGINEQDQQILTTEISVVFHSAATVNFNEKLKTAIDINVRGTRELLRLCKQMSRLKAVVHVSTAYSNCAENTIEEKFYPTHIESEKLIALGEVLDANMMQILTPSLLGSFPNNYALTKAIAETTVREVGKDLPVAVYRPSIVISTYREPLEGWSNNLYGPLGVAAGSGTGILRVVHADPNANANMVPGDMCVNALIAVPWQLDNNFREAQKNNQNFEIPIYHYESSEDQPINWGTHLSLVQKYGLCIPTIHAVWYHSLLLIKNLRVYQIAAFFLHYVPAYLVDAILVIIGKNARFTKIYKKIHGFIEVLSYFSTKTFKFKSTKIREIISNMSPQDQDIFFCDLRKLNWDQYFKAYYKGVRIYLLKDPMSTLPQALKRWTILYYSQKTLETIFGLVLIKILWILLYNIIV